MAEVKLHYSFSSSSSFYFYFFWTVDNFSLNSINHSAIKHWNGTLKICIHVFKHRVLWWNLGLYCLCHMKYQTQIIFYIESLIFTMVESLLVITGQKKIFFSPEKWYNFCGFRLSMIFTDNIYDFFFGKSVTSINVFMLHKGVGI